MRKFIAILAMLLLCAPVVAQRVTSLGPAPTGYTWHSPRDAAASILKPDGWFTKSEAKGGTDALFISKEDISTDGSFQTGLSLHFVRGVKKATGLTASKYAYAFLSKALEGNEQLTSFGGPSNGMMSLGLRVKNMKLNKVIHYYFVANDKEDTLHMFMFEAPIVQWESAWEIGEPMFRNLRLVFPK